MTFVIILMLDPDPNPEQECITGPVPLCQVVAVPVPKHCIFSNLSSSSCRSFLPSVHRYFFNSVCFKTPSDSSLPSFAPKDFMPSLFFLFFVG